MRARGTPSARGHGETRAGTDRMAPDRKTPAAANVRRRERLPDGLVHDHMEGALDRPRGPLPTRVRGPGAAPGGVRETLDAGLVALGLVLAPGRPRRDRRPRAPPPRLDRGHQPDGDPRARRRRPAPRAGLAGGRPAARRARHRPAPGPRVGRRVPGPAARRGARLPTAPCWWIRSARRSRFLRTVVAATGLGPGAPRNTPRRGASPATRATARPGRR